MEQMRRRMVPSGRIPDSGINLSRDGVSYVERPVSHLDLMRARQAGANSHDAVDRC